MTHSTSPIFSERFWSEASASSAAARVRARGYTVRVRYATCADGTSGWLMEAF